MPGRPAIFGVAAAALAIACLDTPARGETAEEFFKGKQINLVIGYNPGGTYDIYARLAANLLPKYIPGNPKIIPQNMPGVGSAKAGDYLFNQASRDGLTLGMIGQQLVVSQALGDATVKFDISKFHWLGRFTTGGELTAVWHTSPTKTLADAMKRETTIAATSAGSSSDSLLQLMNRLAGTQFKIIRGYRGVAGTILAMERGETEGGHATVEQLLFARKDWLREKKVNVLVQYSMTRHAAFADVPAMSEFGKTPLDRQVIGLFAGAEEIGRAIVLPPGVPADRLAVLRKAFDDMVKDPAFRQELDQRNLEFDPMPGAKVQERVAEMLGVSPEVVKHAIAASR
jgi:tripartite-type tricarboxylate transporter receptor subunit TctC